MLRPYAKPVTLPAARPYQRSVSLQYIPEIHPSVIRFGHPQRCQRVDVSSPPRPKRFKKTFWVFSPPCRLRKAKNKRNLDVLLSACASNTSKFLFSARPSRFGY